MPRGRARVLFPWCRANDAETRGESFVLSRPWRETAELRSTTKLRSLAFVVDILVARFGIPLALHEQGKALSISVDILLLLIQQHLVIQKFILEIN